MAMGKAGSIEIQFSCPEEVGKDFHATLKSFTLRTKGRKGRKRKKKMSKHIVKTLSMLTLVVGLALAAGVKSANGQITSHSVTAAIPFDFIVGEKTMPAGRYIVSSATSDGTGLKIQSRNGTSAFRLSNPVVEKSQKRKVRMVFHRYGEQYFLAQVWSGDGNGCQLTRSKLEPKGRQELGSNKPLIDSKEKSYQVVEVVAMLR